jgi:hypothetical protein
MGRKKPIKRPAKPRARLNPPEDDEHYRVFIPRRERTLDFGHYGCTHTAVAPLIFKRDGRWWCGACYAVRFGIAASLDPKRES